MRDGATAREMSGGGDEVLVEKTYTFGMCD
jgi:hypothetical protein